MKIKIHQYDKNSFCVAYEEQCYSLIYRADDILYFDTKLLNGTPIASHYPLIYTIYCK